MKILLIDDNHSDLRLIKEKLEGALEGSEFICAVDGESGVKKFEELRPDLVITDLNLPKNNGYSVCYSIKKISPSTKIIIHTGSYKLLNHKRAIDCGAEILIKKSQDCKELVGFIQSNINLAYIEN